MVVNGGKTPTPLPKVKASPTSRITKIASLNRFPDKEYAALLLHDVAKEVAPLMQEYNFKVGLLCEMYPKSGNLLGLNINGGQKIMLRLRYHSNDRLFLPMSDILGTMLHELTHNVHGPHHAKFYELLDELKLRYSTLGYKPVQGYYMEESRLGGISRITTTSIRDRRIKALTKKFKTETRKLGGTKLDGNLRKLALEAAERRQNDNKWCNEEAKEAEPEDNDLDIIEINSLVDPISDTNNVIVID